MVRALNKQAFTVLIVYPAILIGLGINYFMNYPVGLAELGIAALGYYGANIAIGVGMHRCYSHSSFKSGKLFDFFMVFLTAGALQGPILAWCSDHYKHHTFTDQEQDPHTPLKGSNRFWGFLWAHMGWMLFHEDNKQIDRITIVKLGKNSMLRWQLKYYWEIAIFMSLIFPAILGYIVGGTMLCAYKWFLFIGLGRALQQQATCCVNSMCHYLGTHAYQKGTAGDIWWMAPFLLGENWHNFHHAFPSDYRNGHKWYQLDVHKWITYALAKLGLIWDLNATQEVRIKAKMKETKQSFLDEQKEQLGLLQNKADNLMEDLTKKFTELETSSINLKNQVQKSFLEVQSSLKKLVEQIQKASEQPSEGIVKMARGQLAALEDKIYKICNHWVALKA